MLKPKEPYVVPAVEAETYPGQWLGSVVIHSPATDSASLKIELLPYRPAGDGKPEKIGPVAGMEVIHVHDLFDALTDPAYPEVAQAFGAILAAIPKLRERQSRE